MLFEQHIAYQLLPLFLGLQNDHKALMKQIEEGLHKVHAQAREKKQEKTDREQLTGIHTGEDSAKMCVW